MTAATRLISRLTLVTGGGSGIGRAVCQRLASEGASVVVADISEESANETMVGLQNELRGQGHMAAVVDVSSKESVKKLVTRIQPPSVCVNAAGITQDHFLLNMEEDHFDRVIQVNLKGSFLITQAVAQALVACGAPKGSIITVGSIVGKVRELQRDEVDRDTQNNVTNVGTIGERGGEDNPARVLYKTIMPDVKTPLKVIKYDTAGKLPYCLKQILIQQVLKS
uniref:Estradiol 17-beta-dehydrogenase 8-like n=1 Tax=Labrus bergylta TaxID=56723 RepID=A0A3Q3M6T7_9LABR